MEIRIRDDRLKYAIIDFIGEADVTAMAAIQEKIEKTYRETERRIICNMSEVKHINSSGVNGFLIASKTVINGGGEIIFSAMQPHVERVFKLGRLDKYLKFFSSLSEAEQYFKSFGKIDTSLEENILILEKKNTYIKPHLTRIAAQCLQISPIKIFMAKGIDQGLRFLKHKQFSLVLIDGTLSLGEGKGFIEQVLSSDGHANLPMLVVMTDETIENAAYFIRAGAHDVISFPFKSVEVESRLRLLMTLAKRMAVG